MSTLGNSSEHVSPVDESTIASRASEAAYSDKEFLEPDQGLFTVVEKHYADDHRGPVSPLTFKSELHHDSVARQPQAHKIAGSAPPVISLEEKETVPGQDLPGTKSKSRRKFWIIGAIALVIVVGLAVGLGVGLGTKKNQAQSQSPNSTTPNTPNTPDNSNSLIQSNSSIAAVETTLGDRFVFFQDGQGDIRWASYSNTTSKWVASNILDLTINPKDNTPLGAYIQPGDNFNVQSLIELVYIAANNTVTEIEVAPDMSVKSKFAVDSRPIVAAEDVSRIAVISSMRPGNDEYLDSFLMLRTSAGVGLWEREDNRSDWNFLSPSGYWYDATGDLKDTIKDQSLCEPFAASTYFSGNGTNGEPRTLAQYVISNCDQTSPRVIAALYNKANETYTTSSQTVYTSSNKNKTPSVQNTPLVTDSEWSAVQGSPEWYFVNDGALSAFSFQNGPLNQPIIDAPFPYPHLTTLKYAWGVKSQYLYNQLSATKFAEHIYNNITQVWTTNEIDLSTLSSSSSQNQNN